MIGVAGSSSHGFGSARFTTMQKHRLFVALDLPAELSEQLGSMRHPALDARWMGAAQRHLTLAFIGPVEAERMAAVREALGAVRANGVTLEISGVGAFPSPRRARVLVAQVSPDAALMQLQRNVVASLSDVGIEPEDRPYRPHVTLARLKDPQPEAVRAFLNEYSALRLRPFPVDRFYLYESILHPSGAEYVRRETYAIGNNGAA